MKLTQGCFSFLPDLTDDQITKQVQYCLDNGWAVNIEFTDDPHPRNTYWEMWGLPMFDLQDAAGVMMELAECRRVYGDRYIRLSGFDSSHGWESVRISFIVNRPPQEAGFRLVRQEVGGRAIRYTTVRRHARARANLVIPLRAEHSLLRFLGGPLLRRSPRGEALFFEVPMLDVRTRRPLSPARPVSISARRPKRPESPARLQQLEQELIGLRPVKNRVRQIASLLLIERIRQRAGLASAPPTLHMSFTGNPGTGKTTVALRMAKILHGLGFVRRGQVISVTRDDLVGQYIGHTAPKTKEILKKAMGGVLFIDEAYYLHRPDNERDYGQEAIEILLQVMENQREDLVVILAGYGERMDSFFATTPASARASPITSTSRTMRKPSCSSSPS